MQLWSSGTGMPARPSYLEHYTDTGSTASQGGRGGGGNHDPLGTAIYCKKLLFLVRNYMYLPVLVVCTTRQARIKVT